VHADAAHADALATGLSVLGPDEGYALAEREGLAAYFIVREPEGGLRSFATSAFPPVERADE
jgi:thiamine biosynthesis lipoprotein